MGTELIITAFQSLGLEDLDADWIEAMESSEFTEEPDVDLSLPTSLANNLQECNDALRSYLKNVSSSADARSSLLHDLSHVGINCKNIKCWLYYLFHNGLKLSANFDQKLLSIQAAGFYFLLLRIPGMNSSDLHQPIIFEKSVDSLLITTELKSNSPSDTTPRKRRGNEGNPARKRKKKASNRNTDANDESVLDDSVMVISPENVSCLVDSLVLALRDFCLYLASVSLRSNEMAVKQVIKSLVKLAIHFQTNCPLSIIDFPSFKADGSSAYNLSMAYQLVVYALFLVVSVKHGDLDHVVLILFRFTLQILIMKNATGSSSVPRAYYQNAEIFRRLVCHLFDVHGSAVEHGISVLTQNMIAQCPDRVEYRNHCAVVVACILNHMPLKWFAEFCDWLRRVSVHVKITYRSNAVAVVSKLLCQSERRSTQGCEGQSFDSAKHGLLLEIVVARLMDVAPSVRSRSLAALVEIMEAGVVSPSVLGSVTSGQNKDSERLTPVAIGSVSEGIATPPTLHSVPASMINQSENALNQTSLMHLLKKCTLEMKSMVRKTAVHAVQMAFNYGFVAPNAESLDVISVRCRDPSVAVRKFAVGSITSVLLHHSNSPEAVLAWSRGVLPALLDGENSVQEKALQLVQELIIDNISAAGDKKELAWKLMGFISSAEGDSSRTYFKMACKLLKRQSKLGALSMNQIIDKLSDTEYSAAAWSFLQIYTLYHCDKKASDKVFKVWSEELKKEKPLIVHINAVLVIGQVCKSLSEEFQKQALNACCGWLKNLKCPVQLVAYLVQTILNLIEAMHRDKSSSDEWPRPLMHWGEVTLKQVDEFLYKFVILNADNDAVVNKQSLIHQLHVAGNVGMHCTEKVPKRLLLTMQALLTSTECLTEIPRNLEQSSQDMPQSQPLSQFAQGGGVPANVRAHALINLGKICLNNESLAKKCVHAMVRELDSSTNEMLKINVLAVLTDLCVQQTQLVDSHIPDIANCLGDESVAVRKNALVLISDLLKKDFVKWRGSLIYKFLALLCDPSAEIRDLVRYSFTNQTLQRNAGDTFFRHFVEAVFYLNSYTKHNTYNRFAKSARETRSFNFSGPERIADRTAIYNYMLEQMDDGHRIKLVGKLCTDVLDGVVDGVLPLNGDADPVLADALSIISSQQIKLQCMKPVDEELIEEGMQDNAAATASNVIKQTIISQVIKRNLVENIMPILIALKNKLVSCKSHAVKNVMQCIKEIMKDYKTEVQDLLAADKQLATEIEFDLKRFESEESEREGADKERVDEASVRRSLARKDNGTPQSRTPRSRDSPANHKAGIPGKENVPQLLLTPATGGRRPGLGIEAMLNSARRAMATLKVPGCDKDSNVRRAISTPAKAGSFSDLTFNLNEISAIANTERQSS